MKLLDRLYTQRASKSYLASSDQLLRAAQEKDPSITRKEVQKFLDSRESYQMTNEQNKRAPQLYPKMVTTAPYQEMHCDLAFWSRNAFVYLICRDLFSGMTHAQYMGNRKDAARTLRAFQKIEKEIKFPLLSVAYDSGTEFQQVSKYLRDKHRRAKQLKSFQHAYAAEKAISDIRKLYRRYKVATGRSDIRKSIGDFVKTINKRHNRVTKMSALDALKVENFGKVFSRRYGRYLTRLHKGSKAKFQPGDRVRILNFVSASEKSKIIKPPTRFSSSIFTVYKRVPHSHPPSYIVVDDQQREINRPIYERNLYRVHNES